MTNKEAIELLKNAVPQDESLDEEGLFIEAVNMAIKALEKAETNCPEIPDSWVPVTEDLPKTTDPVNITWVNHDPEVYYSDIKDKPFTATACFCNGKWWWYSAVCKDFLDEYGKCDMDQMDDAIEVTAWKPLPEPWKGETDGKTD